MVCSLVEGEGYNQNREQILYSVGDAQVIRNLCGTISLCGGSAQDRDKALEWAARFLPSVADSITKSETGTSLPSKT
ncbi:MAG: hypothetical protein JWM16_396 [Verrucomicrobiales bacterium]|nr:hypothetical protein [Verrucomicrobiales bacterium]